MRLRKLIIVPVLLSVLFSFASNSFATKIKIINASSQAPSAKPAAVSSGVAPQSSQPSQQPQSQQSSQPLSFVVRETLKQNPVVLKSGATTMAAKENLQVARGGFFPNVDARFSAGREKMETFYNATKSESEGTLNNNQTVFAITQPLFSGFSTYNLTKQRREEINAASYAEKYNKEVLALQAIYAYMNVLRFNELQALAEKNIVTHKEILGMVRTKFVGGAGQKPDVDLAIARLAQRQATLSTILGSKEVSKANFLQVVGFAPQNLYLPVAVPNLPQKLVEALDIALERNQALLSAKASFKAYMHAENTAKAALLPTVNLELSSNAINNPSGLEGRSKDLRGMIVVNYNLFNGASDFANIRRVAYNRTASMYDMYDTRAKVIESVAKAWQQLIYDQLSFKSYAAHVRASEDVLSGYKEQFELGRNSLLNVLDMENEVFNAKVAMINAEYAVINDRYELLAAMGMLAAYFTA